MNLHCLFGQTSDYSFVIRFFGESGRLPEHLHYCAFEELDKKLSTSRMHWDKFFDEVQSCIGWETFIGKLLDEVGYAGLSQT